MNMMIITPHEKLATWRPKHTRRSTTEDLRRGMCRSTRRIVPPCMVCMTMRLWTDMRKEKTKQNTTIVSQFFFLTETISQSENFAPSVAAL